MMTKKEIIIVEGKADTEAVKRCFHAFTIETHGYGISDGVWKMMDKAYDETGLIIFTDPDHAGERIRRRLISRYPRAKQAFLSRDAARKKSGVGVENADNGSIIEAILKARPFEEEEVEDKVTMEMLIKTGLSGGAGSAAKRKKAGRSLGIGECNSKTFLRRTEMFKIDRKAFYKALEDL